MKKQRIEGGQFFLDEAGARIEEIKSRIVLDGENENCIRIWQSFWPDGFKLQLRVWGRIGKTMNGKKRFMIGTVDVSIKELEAALAYMRDQARPLVERGQGPNIQKGELI